MKLHFLIFVLAYISQAYGKFSEWNKWSSCTNACGPGVKRRERLLPPLSGEPCHSTMIEEKNCNGQTCARTTLISQGKSATASSNAFNRYFAKFAVDGNTNGRLSAKSCMHTNKEDNPWLRIDLGKSHIVQRFVVYNREECCQDLLNNFYVTVGNDRTGKSNKVCSRIGSLGNETEISATCSSHLEGRYVHLFLPGHQFLVVCEFQIYGAASQEISRSRTVTMSPGSSNPHYAVDGRANTYATSKKDTANPFITVDLGMSRFISQIHMYSFIANTESEIRIGNSQRVEENLVCTKIEAERNAAARSRILNCGKVMEGRYVTLTMAGKTQLQLGEFRIDGY